MNHRTGLDRSQTLLFPERLEDYIAAENPVRFLDAFVASLDLHALGFANPRGPDQFPIRVINAIRGSILCGCGCPLPLAGIPASAFPPTHPDTENRRERQDDRIYRMKPGWPCSGLSFLNPVHPVHPVN